MPAGAHTTSRGCAAAGASACALARGRGPSAFGLARVIARVAPDSAAARAGLRVGDVLVEVHGAPIEDAFDVLAALDATRADAAAGALAGSGHAGARTDDPDVISSAASRSS